MTRVPDRYRKLPDAVSTEIGDEVAVLNMRNGAYLGLNATAAFIWRALDTSSTVSAICERVVREFAVGEDAGLAAVESLLARLERHGVLERVSDETA